MKKLIFIIVLVIALMTWAMIHDARQWEKFKAAHNCKVISRTASTVVPTVTTSVGADGQVSTGITSVYVPGKTGYLCDDGVTYWR